MTDEEIQQFREKLREQLQYDIDTQILDMLTPRIVCPECLGSGQHWSGHDEPPEPCEFCRARKQVKITEVFKSLEVNAILTYLRSLDETYHRGLAVSIHRAVEGRLPPDDCKIIADYVEGRWPLA